METNLSWALPCIWHSTETFHLFLLFNPHNIPLISQEQKNMVLSEDMCLRPSIMNVCTFRMRGQHFKCYGFPQREKLCARSHFLLCFLLCKERIPESPSPAPSLEESHRPGSQTSSHPSSSVSSSPSQMDHHSERMGEYLTWSKELKDNLSGNSSLGNREGRKTWGNWCFLKSGDSLLQKQYEQQKRC